MDLEGYVTEFLNALYSPATVAGAIVGALLGAGILRLFTSAYQSIAVRISERARHKEEAAKLWREETIIKLIHGPPQLTVIFQTKTQALRLNAYMSILLATFTAFIAPISTSIPLDPIIDLPLPDEFKQATLAAAKIVGIFFPMILFYQAYSVGLHIKQRRGMITEVWDALAPQIVAEVKEADDNEGQ